MNEKRSDSFIMFILYFLNIIAMFFLSIRIKNKQLELTKSFLLD